MSEGPGVRGATRTEEPSAVERTIARRVAEARATVPHLELDAEVDVSGTPDTALLVRACAAALREVPRANGAYRDGRFELYSRVNIGVVVAHPDGYMIPTVFDADRKALAELREEIAELTASAVAGELAAPALGGATFTVWNAGELGVTRAGMVVGPAQVAGLAAGAVRDVARGQEAGAAMTITLACDHRMLYGAQAAAFLAAVKSALETTQ